MHYKFIEIKKYLYTSKSNDKLCPSIRVSHKFLSHHVKNDFNCLCLYKYTGLSISSMVSISRTFLKYTSLVTQFLLKISSTPFNMNSQRKYLQHVILHRFKKDNSAKDTADKICIVYSSDTTAIMTVRNWFKRFRASNFYLKDEDRSGHPTTTVTLSRPCSLKIRDIVDAANIPRTTVHNYLIKMGYVNRCEVWVPHLLTKTGLINRVSMCNLLLQQHERNSFLKRLVIGDYT